jgi:hypothetical protein
MLKMSNPVCFFSPKSFEFKVANCASPVVAKYAEPYNRTVVVAYAEDDSDCREGELNRLEAASVYVLIKEQAAPVRGAR